MYVSGDTDCGSSAYNNEVDDQREEAQRLAEAEAQRVAEAEAQRVAEAEANRLPDQYEPHVQTQSCPEEQPLSVLPNELEEPPPVLDTLALQPDDTTTDNDALSQFLLENPEIDTNQDIINHFYEQGGYAALQVGCDELGLDPDAVFADRQSNIGESVFGPPEVEPPPYVTLEEWKAAATEAGMPLEDFVMSTLELSPEHRDLIATVGFVETRSLGIEAMGLVSQTVLNTLLSSDPYFTSKYDTVEEAAQRYAEAGSYGHDYLSYLADTEAGLTNQSNQAELLDPAKDFAWRLMAGYATGDPTEFLNDPEATWTQALPEGRTVEDVMANVEQSYEYKNEFEGNPTAASLAPADPSDPDGPTWYEQTLRDEAAIHRARYEAAMDRGDAQTAQEELRLAEQKELAANSFVGFVVGDRAFVSHAGIGPYLSQH